MLKLSDEALGAVMMALQKSLLEQSDIVPVLKGFDFRINEDNQLFIMNPPLVKMKKDFLCLILPDGQMILYAQNVVMQFQYYMKECLTPIKLMNV